MAFRTALIAALVASASAFAPSTMSTQRSGAVALNAEMSKALPFLPRPEKLDGGVGDFGFDPMGLSEIQQDLYYARWAELKNGRVAMLALLGLITQEYIHLPGEAYQNPNPFEAPGTVGLGVNVQILLGIGVVELMNFDKHYDGTDPGYIGWTGGFFNNKSQAEIDRLKLSEIKHCRLAMIAFMGASVQTLLFHQPLLG